MTSPPTLQPDSHRIPQPRADGLCPKCGQRDPIVRDIHTPFYEKALKLAATLDTMLPAPLCEVCLALWVEWQRARAHRDLEHDQRAWTAFLEGLISTDELFSRLRDPSLYRAGANKIAERRRRKGADAI